MTECVKSIPDTCLHVAYKNISAYFKTIYGLFNNTANVLAHKVQYFYYGK